MCYDFIGDIHGYADALTALLDKLGYSNEKGYYSHSSRKVIFVGDYVDRGSQIRETLAIVKGMVDNEQAIALMGNHEFNAILFNLEKPTGGFYRPHTEKNIHQHKETLQQFNDHQDEYNQYISWFLTIPLYYETSDFRAVHACWSDDNINYLKRYLKNGTLTREAIITSFEEDEMLFKALDETLKGKELKMPGDLYFTDKDGHQRTEIRIKWWEAPAGRTYEKYCVEQLNQPQLNQVIPEELCQNVTYYSHSDKPVFIGHYWLCSKPALMRENVCCLDYSIANNGHLVAYRFSGEKELKTENLVYV